MREKRSEHFLSNKIDEKGHTLFESLIALLLSSLLFTLLGGGILKAIQLETMTKSSYQALEVNSLLQSEIGKILSDYDENPVSTGIVIHKNGSVKLLNGLPHSISKLNSTSRPRPGSDAISWLKMSYRDASYVKRSSSKIELCPLFNFKNAETPVSFLGLTTHESFQAIVTLGNVNSLGCREAQIKGIDSIFAPNIDRSLIKFTNLLIPIYSESTIYIDASGQLRYVGHVGNLIREDQPITRGLRTMKLGLQQFGLQDAYTFRLMTEVSLSSGQIIKFEKDSLLTRHLPIELSSVRVR